MFVARTLRSLLSSVGLTLAVVALAGCASDTHKPVVAQPPQVNAGVTPGDVIANDPGGCERRTHPQQYPRPRHGRPFAASRSDRPSAARHQRTRDSHDASLPAAGTAAAGGSRRATSTATGGRRGRSLLGSALLSPPLLLVATSTCLHAAIGNWAARANIYLLHLQMIIREPSPTKAEAANAHVPGSGTGLVITAA